MLLTWRKIPSRLNTVYGSRSTLTRFPRQTHNSQTLDPFASPDTQNAKTVPIKVLLPHRSDYFPTDQTAPPFFAGVG